MPPALPTASGRGCATMPRRSPRRPTSWSASATRSLRPYDRPFLSTTGPDHQGALEYLVDVEETWTRPYSPGPGRWLVIGWEAAALAMLAWATIRQFDLTGHGVK